MIRRVLLGLIPILCHLLNVSAQRGDRAELYTVDDTIQVTIAPQPIDQYFSSILAKSNDRDKKTYTTNDLLGYRTQNGLFLSGLVEEAFLSVLLRGEVSLFEGANGFYIQKGEGETFLLDESTGEAKLESLLSDCRAMQFLEGSISLKRKALIDLITEYNYCKGLDSEIVSSKNVKYKPMVKWGFLAGASLNVLTVIVDQPFLDADNAPALLPDLYRPYDQSFTSVSPTIGLNMILDFPGKSNFGLGLGVRWESFEETYDLGEDTRTLLPFTIVTDRQLSIRQNRVSVPAFLKWNMFSFWPGKVEIQLGLGPEFNQHQLAEADEVEVRSFTSDVTTERTYDLFVPEDIQLFTYISLGYYRDTSFGEAGLSLRYDRTQVYGIEPVRGEISAVSQRWVLLFEVRL